jgi:hypothetical protein
MRYSSRTGRRPALSAALGVLALALLVPPPPALTQIVVTPVTPLPAPQPFCVLTLDPPPTGTLGRPAASFPSADHKFIHSSVHLQGLPVTEKWAGGLVQHPPASTAVPPVWGSFDKFTSAVVVDNPDPNASIGYVIDYFAYNGTLVGTSTGTLPPNGHHVEAATPLDPAVNPIALGVGSARITTTADTGLVGEVLTHARCVLDNPAIPGSGVCDAETPVSLNGCSPGASESQQLQAVQWDRTELWWGPLPLTQTSKIDFFNSEAPFLWVVNPNGAANTIREDIVIFDRNLGTSRTVTYRTITLNPNGTLFEKSGAHLTAPPGLWDQFVAAFPTLGSGDFDLLVHVKSLSGLPILGDGVMTDFVGDDHSTDPPAQIPGRRFRMSSQMLANTPNWRLVNPDMSYQAPPNGIVQTLMGLFNVGTADAGPVRLEYFDRNGALILAGTIPSLPPNRSVRIVPGGTVPYPVGTVGFGWVRISACTPSARLVGWTVREILDTPPSEPHYHKSPGESLDGINGKEPGPGFAVSTGGITWIRKVAPLVRVDLGFPWPDYTTFANTSVGNVGPYWYRFFSAPGGSCTNASSQPFAGVPWAATSTSYDDPEATCNGNLHGAVDITSGLVQGIQVLGDPYDEYFIPGFATCP